MRRNDDGMTSSLLVLHPPAVPGISVRFLPLPVPTNRPETSLILLILHCSSPLLHVAKSHPGHTTHHDDAEDSNNQKYSNREKEP